MHLHALPTRSDLQHGMHACVRAALQACVRLQAPSMLVCSLFSVCAGGSLGPEAPLLCLCASTVSYLFQEILPVKPAMLRYCSLMGMAAGLAAFFGVTMGGAQLSTALHATCSAHVATCRKTTTCLRRCCSGSGCALEQYRKSAS